MHHAVDVAVETDEQTELGDRLDLAFDLGARRMGDRKALPRIFHALLEAEADAPLVGIDFQHLDFDFRPRRDDLGGGDVLLHPAHLGDVDQALDARLQLHKGAVVGDVGDLALEARADRIFGADAFPGIGLQLLHAEADALRLLVDLDDLHGDVLANVEHLGRMTDAAPGDVGDVQQPVDAAQIHEGAVVGDVLDHTFDDLAFLERGHQRGALLGAALFEHGAAGDDDVAAAAIHLQDLEGLRLVHQRADIAHWPNVDLRAREKCHGAIQIDGEAALDAAEDHAGDALFIVEGLLQTNPAFLAAGLVAAQHRFAERIFDALQIDLDRVADIDVRRLARHREFLEGHTAFGLQSDIDDGEIILDGDDGAADDRAFLRGLALETGFEHRLEVGHGGGGDGFGGSLCHAVS